MVRTPPFDPFSTHASRRHWRVGLVTSAPYDPHLPFVNRLCDCPPIFGYLHKAVRGVAGARTRNRDKKAAFQFYHCVRACRSLYRQPKRPAPRLQGQRLAPGRSECSRSLARDRTLADRYPPMTWPMRCGCPPRCRARDLLPPFETPACARDIGTYGPLRAKRLTKCKNEVPGRTPRRALLYRAAGGHFFSHHFSRRAAGFGDLNLLRHSTNLSLKRFYSGKTRAPACTHITTGSVCGPAFLRCAPMATLTP